MIGEFPDVFEGRALYPSLLNYVLCCFEEEMGLFEAGIMSFYYGNEFRRICLPGLPRGPLSTFWLVSHGSSQCLEVRGPAS